MDERPTATGAADTPESAGESAADPAADPAAEPVRGRYGERWESIGGADRGETAGLVEDEVLGDATDENNSGSGGLVSHLQNVAEPFADHFVFPVAGAIGTIIEAASQAWGVHEAIVARRLKRQAKEPLLNLYEAYPEAGLASPRELGLRFVPVEEILGTAVAGMAQRGGDFLPLKPFRGENWAGRWRRIREANERMQPLPPVDLIKFGGEYWVVDGHNRVAATLYINGAGLDAMVTELVPLDGRTSERPSNLLSYLGERAELRAAAAGRTPAVGMRHTEQQQSAAETGQTRQTGQTGQTATLGKPDEDPEADPETRPKPDRKGFEPREESS